MRGQNPEPAPNGRGGDQDAVENGAISLDMDVELAQVQAVGGQPAQPDGVRSDL